MANEIRLVTYANSEVTPQNDALLSNLAVTGNGIIYGCGVSIKNASTLHINAGQGIIYGREFEIVDSDISVPLAGTGTLLGQLYVHIDLANISEPASLIVDTGASLSPLEDDPNMNIDTGSSDYQLATFTVDTVTLDNLVETSEVIENVSEILGDADISAIGDGTVKGAISEINNDLSQGSESGNGGYSKLPDGTLIQWGAVDVAAGTYTKYIDFPVSFIDKNKLSIHITPINTGLDYQVKYDGTTVNRTQIGRTPATNLDGFYWLAIGRWK